MEEFCRHGAQHGKETSDCRCHNKQTEKSRLTIITDRVPDSTAVAIIAGSRSSPRETGILERGQEGTQSPEESELTLGKGGPRRGVCFAHVLARSRRSARGLHPSEAIPMLLAKRDNIQSNTKFWADKVPTYLGNFGPLQSTP